MKRNAKKGFTLAELLIVVAILAILVAIMMPVFGAQLNKARAAADLANIRSKYSELVADAMLSGNDLTADLSGTATITVADLVSDVKYACTVTVTQGDAAAGKKGKIEVDVNGITGSFDTDPDVTFDQYGNISVSADGTIG